MSKKKKYELSNVGVFLIETSSSILAGFSKIKTSIISKKWINENIQADNVETDMQRGSDGSHSYFGF
jgi:hypothetical protein